MRDGKGKEVNLSDFREVMRLVQGQQQLSNRLGPKSELRLPDPQPVVSAFCCAVSAH